MTTINRSLRCYTEVMEVMTPLIDQDETFLIAEYIREYNGMIIFDDSYTNLVQTTATKLKLLPNLVEYVHDFIKLTMPYRHWCKQKSIESIISKSILGTDMAKYISEIY